MRPSFKPLALWLYMYGLNLYTNEDLPRARLPGTGAGTGAHISSQPSVNQVSHAQRILPIQSTRCGSLRLSVRQQRGTADEMNWFVHLIGHDGQMRSVLVGVGALCLEAVVVAVTAPAMLFWSIARPERAVQFVNIYRTWTCEIVRAVDGSTVRDAAMAPGKQEGGRDSQLQVRRWWQRG